MSLAGFARPETSPCAKIIERALSRLALPSGIAGTQAEDGQRVLSPINPR